MYYAFNPKYLNDIILPPLSVISLLLNTGVNSEEREPRMMRSMDHSLIHIGLITTMALAIVPSSRMTRIGWRGSTIVWWTLTSRSYKAVIRRIAGC